MIYLFSWLKLFRITLLQFFCSFHSLGWFYTVSTYPCWTCISQNFYHWMVSHKRNLDETQRWKECNKHYPLKGARDHCSFNILVLIIWLTLWVWRSSQACNWILIMLNFTWALRSWKIEKSFSPHTHTLFCVTENKLTAKNQPSSYGLNKTYRYSSCLPMARPDT